ncbi:glucosamine-6-phosphate deaminase [Rubinisphaera brasiliensis]|uniref:Glucosamine-6-phosphate deaminase n=1 Tax=Rubinisphaera brasiliensis (strain ATCC 49424 / DSM 5305 / JCM 21570 / IAM 15109 / NBRC 103401 / IFAM 1448) TaxID=756272 RepID=F0SL82_RUBBR|nr:glucosamine-6-phosphate deaminase [Rubinisphaera brasiliensis]ADY60965.1 Glucosamine-6-phosphate deaminase [Rubinisphaera brasiliensis DSM 5305]
MEIVVAQDASDLGRQAAEVGAECIRAALEKQGEAAILVATGASQFETLKHLVEAPGIDWSKVTAFHLDEYIGLDDSHPASFRKYLRERFVDKVPLKTFHYVNGDAADPSAECQRLGDIIGRFHIDVAFIGIGENGHLAFNDPPADFETRDPYLVVDLDEACRRQQLGEGWFPTLEDVPQNAISMSVQQILASDVIVCSVPDSRKAEAVKGAVEGTVSPELPASILQTHRDTHLFLDPPAASQLAQAAQ